MAEAKTNGFRWLPSYYVAVRDLPDEYRLALYDAIADYGFGNEIGELPPMLNAIFSLIRPTLEKSVKFEDKQKANGAKGGRPKGKPRETQNESGFPEEKPKETETNFGENLDVDIDVDVDVDDDVDIDVEKSEKQRATKEIGKQGKEREGKHTSRTRKAFTPPTLEEVRAYCRERNSSVDPDQFYAYYTADPDRQWIDAKGNPVTSWKQKMLTWEKFDKPKKSGDDLRDSYDMMRGWANE